MPISKELFMMLAIGVISGWASAIIIMISKNFFDKIKNNSQILFILISFVSIMAVILIVFIALIFYNSIFFDI